MKNRSLLYKFYFMISISIAAIPLVFIVLGYMVFFGHRWITARLNINESFQESIITSYFYLMFFAILFSLMFLGARYFKRVIERVTEMEKTVKKIAGDADFPDKLEVTNESEDELNQLAHSINTLIDRLRAKELEISQMEDLRREYLKQLSHDINTPLNALNLELYLYNQEHGIPQDEAGVLYSKVDYISKLVNTISSQALFDVNNYYVFKKEVELNGLIDKTMEKWFYLLNKNQVEVNIERKIILKWTADDLWIERLFENIISNIFRHSHTKQLDIIIDNQLIIKDYGKGFDKSEAANKTGNTVIDNICQKFEIQLNISSSHGGTVYTMYQKRKYYNRPQSI